MFKWLYRLFFREPEITKELREECNVTLKKMQYRTEQMKTSLNLIQDQVIKYKAEGENNAT